jgi:hypothetical protein
MPDGTRSAEEMKAVYDRVIIMERVQPSVVLRLLYRGDAWIMQGLVRQVLGRERPRNQPLEAWDQDARDLIAKLAEEA